MKQLKRFMRTAAALFAVLSVIFFVSHLHHDNQYSFACFITFLTCFYHFAYRLLVELFMSKSASRLRHNSNWFAIKKFEEPIFKFLKVKRWKDKFTTVLPSIKTTDKFPVEFWIKESCCSELKHEINIVLSFAPFIISLFFGKHVWIFLLTGLATAAFDVCFITFFRQLRPRLVKQLNTK